MRNSQDILLRPVTVAGPRPPERRALPRRELGEESWRGPVPRTTVLHPWCIHAPPYQVLRSPHSPGHQGRATVPGILPVEQGGAGAEARQPLVLVQLTGLAGTAGQAVARVRAESAVQKVDVPPIGVDVK